MGGRRKIIKHVQTLESVGTNKKLKRGAPKTLIPFSYQTPNVVLFSQDRYTNILNFVYVCRWSWAVRCGTGTVTEVRHVEIPEILKSKCVWNFECHHICINV